MPGQCETAESHICSGRLKPACSNAFCSCQTIGHFRTLDAPFTKDRRARRVNFGQRAENWNGGLGGHVEAREIALGHVGLLSQTAKYEKRTSLCKCNVKDETNA